MTRNIPITQPARHLEPATSIGSMLAALARVYRLELADNPEAKKALASAYREVVGEHSEEILDTARQIILATRIYPTFPTPGEVCGAILSAYEKSGLPLSEDGKRLTELRSTSDRYVAGADGRKRFVAKLSLGLVGFHKLTGHDGNRILDAVDIATVDHVERTIDTVSKNPKLRPTEHSPDMALGDLRERLEATTFEVAAFDKFGPLAEQCGNDIATYEALDVDRRMPKRVAFSAKWIGASGCLVDELIAAYSALLTPPRDVHLEHLRSHFTDVEQSIAVWRLHQVFQGFTGGGQASFRSDAPALVHSRYRCPHYSTGWNEGWVLGVRHYGRGLQAAFEKQFQLEVEKLAARLTKPAKPTTGQRSAHAEFI